MQKTFIPLLLAAMLLTGGCSSPKPLGTGNIRHLEAGSSGPGMFYALPHTVFAIDVEVLHTARTPGPYAAYARRYLGLEGVINRSTDTYEISRVSISGFAEPDPTQVYYIGLPAADNQGRSMYLSLTESGLILGINRPDAETGTRGQGHLSKDYGRFGTDATFNHFMDSNLREQIDTIVEQMRVDTLTVQRQTLRRSWVEKSTELRASEVAEYILQIREKKFDLISGFQEINYSKEALEYMYSEMDKLESDYLDLFTGITSKSTIRYRFLHTPDKNLTGQKQSIFRFSHTEGVNPDREGDGMPVSILYDRSQVTDLLTARSGGQADEDRRSAAGIHYRIPEYGNIALYVGDTKRAEARLLVNQFGVVTYLPPGILDMEFYPDTGSLRSVGEEER